MTSGQLQLGEGQQQRARLAQPACGGGLHHTPLKQAALVQHYGCAETHRLQKKRLERITGVALRSAQAIEQHQLCAGSGNESDPPRPEGEAAVEGLSVGCGAPICLGFTPVAARTMV